MFYACYIYVLWFNCVYVLPRTKKHKLPHIHVKYAEKEAVYQIPEGTLLEGTIPANKDRLIVAWIEIHKEDLMANWLLATSGNKVFLIDPLK